MYNYWLKLKQFYLNFRGPLKSSIKYYIQSLIVKGANCHHFFCIIFVVIHNCTILPLSKKTFFFFSFFFSFCLESGVSMPLRQPGSDYLSFLMQIYIVSFKQYKFTLNLKFTFYIILCLLLVIYSAQQKHRSVAL